MKKVALVLVVLLLLALAGAAIFVATFNADRYRPVVVEQLQKALGKPVSIDRLSLGWRGGVALQVRGLTVLAEDAPSAEPVIQVELLSAVVRIAPLLRKEVQVVSVVILRPRVHALRDAQGRINLTGAAVAAAPAAAPHQAAQVPGAPPIAFQIDTVQLEDGSVRWTDATAQPPTDVTVENVDVVLTDVTATGLSFKARASAFSPQQNLRLEGHCELPGPNRPGALEQVRLETDLSQLQPQALAHAFPALASAPSLQQGLAGQLVVAADRLPLDPQQLRDASASVTLTNGRVIVPSLASPIEALTLQATLRGDRLEVSQCAGRVAGGGFTATGGIGALSTQPQLSLRLALERLAMAQLLPSRTAEAPRLTGTLSAAFEGTALGLSQPQLLRSLSGSGRVQLVDGAIENLNILRLVFDQIAILPGLVQILQSKLPESYRKKLAERHTLLLPMDQPFRVEGGALTLDPLKAGTDMIEMTGTLTIALQPPSATGPLMLSIEPEMSDALVHSIDQFQGLMDPQGRIQIPAQAQWPQPPAILPDLNYVAQRMITTQVQESLGNLLRKALERSVEPEPSAPQPSAPAP